MIPNNRNQLVDELDLTYCVSHINFKLNTPQNRTKNDWFSLRYVVFLVRNQLNIFTDDERCFIQLHYPYFDYKKQRTGGQFIFSKKRMEQFMIFDYALLLQRNLLVNVQDKLGTILCRIISSRQEQTRQIWLSGTSVLPGLHALIWLISNNLQPLLGEMRWRRFGEIEIGFPLKNEKNLRKKKLTSVNLIMITNW